MSISLVLQLIAATLGIYLLISMYSELLRAKKQLLNIHGSSIELAAKMAKQLLYSGMSLSQITTELKHHGYDINSDDVYNMVMS